MQIDESREEIFSSLHLIIRLAWPPSRQELSTLSALRRFLNLLTFLTFVSVVHLVKSPEKVFVKVGEVALKSE